MATVTVSSQYRVQISKHFRSTVHVGQQMAINVDSHGRLILTPIEQAREILDKTVGLWTDSTDVARGGVKYMDKIRRGCRLEELNLRKK